MGNHVHSLSQRDYNILNADFSLRDRLILNIGVETGLRITDILNLFRRDILSCKPFYIKERKTGKRKRITLTEQTLNLAKMYDKLHHIKHKKKMFINEKTGKPFTRQAIYYHFAKLRRYCKGLIAPHSMRSTYAKEIFKAQGLEATRKALNHDNSKVTKVYLKPNRRKRGSTKKC